MSITYTLNGVKTEYDGPLNACLLDVIREQHHLTGAKIGCKEGECGACSVIIDGQLANSCLVAMGRVAGCDVMTIEGFAKTERFKVLEEAYASVGAVQCGFCIPGMIMASESLLCRHPHPTEEQIRTGLSGNLCRCTGYNAIVKAIMRAAEQGGTLWDQ